MFLTKNTPHFKQKQYLNYQRISLKIIYRIVYSKTHLA